MYLKTEIQNKESKIYRTERIHRPINNYSETSTFLFTDKTRRYKISMDIVDMKKSNNQLDLIDIYRTFYIMIVESTFSSNAHRTIIKIGYILDHKRS